jgi:hypothetical protein
LTWNVGTASIGRCSVKWRTIGGKDLLLVPSRPLIPFLILEGIDFQGRPALSRSSEKVWA